MEQPGQAYMEPSKEAVALEYYLISYSADINVASRIFVAQHGSSCYYFP